MNINKYIGETVLAGSRKQSGSVWTIIHKVPFILLIHPYKKGKL